MEDSAASHRNTKEATMREANGDAPHKLKKVMVFCDGTWCGQLTGTDTNVKILADAIADKAVKTGEPFVSRRDGGIVGCYFDGEATTQACEP